MRTGKFWVQGAGVAKEFLQLVDVNLEILVVMLNQSNCCLCAAGQYY